MEDVKMKISTLWIVVMLNMIFADVLSLYIPEILGDVAAGTTPVKITEELIFVMAIIIEIPIAMIFLSRVLKYKANRLANFIAVAITIVFVVGGGSTTPHYIFIATIEVVAMLLIIWYAWNWPKVEG